MEIVLETPRLILRKFVPEDAGALARVVSDPETMRYYPMRFDRAGVEAWVARTVRRDEAQGYGLWAMDLKTTGEMIGCGITQQEVDGEPLLEIGYHLRRDMWGQGLATEGARACRGYGFQQLKADFLISLIRPENVPSRRAAERNDMKVWKETMRARLLHLVYRVSGRSGMQLRHPPQVCHSEQSEESAFLAAAGTESDSSSLRSSE